MAQDIFATSASFVSFAFKKVRYMTSHRGRRSALSLSLSLLTLLAVLASACSDIYRPSYDYASIEVRAVDTRGAPIPNVQLTLYFGDLHHAYGATRSNGTHTFNFVPAGVYGIAAGHPGEYVPANGAESYRIVSVEKGGELQVEFVFEGPEG